MELKEKLIEIIQPICEGEGFYLLELKISGSVRNPVVQIFADNEQGITLNDCVLLSRKIQDELDFRDDLPATYRLDVSSPGVDHPLKFDWEFKKNLGRTLVVKHRLEDRLWREVGKLIDFSAGQIVLETKHGIKEIKRENIEQAKVKLQW
ncbi:ribosome maturation factor RimP [Caldithrix abyssi]|uniref:Ribosome maturation factor RimP n=1 Tax=Caldithrix abyssi DSM 13497 TaxID=880073 RepID=H1XXN1_CALAY|nr:ribosome maturation factor RimP [Caldithrix abyssi]APF19244.1 rimP ribosome maturation factor RimP [Caldithrix abyssi DSM 13497]EHO43155.1 Ribosome maturation factor rimP [Caldithrix abyssi DSM 13497]